MKLIFLDFDGVLNRLDRDFFNRAPDKYIDKHPFTWLDPDKCAILNDVCWAYREIQVIISSTWRTLYSLQELREILADCRGKQIAQAVIDVTPEFGFRGDEVQAMLEKYDPQAYTIIDDNNWFHDHQWPHFLQTDPKVGFTWDNATQLEHMLDLRPRPLAEAPVEAPVEVVNVGAGQNMVINNMIDGIRAGDAAERIRILDEAFRNQVDALRWFDPRQDNER